MTLKLVVIFFCKLCQFPQLHQQQKTFIFGVKKKVFHSWSHIRPIWVRPITIYWLGLLKNTRDYWKSVEKENRVIWRRTSTTTSALQYQIMKGVLEGIDWIFDDKNIHPLNIEWEKISTGDSLVVEVSYPACPGPRDKVTHY